MNLERTAPIGERPRTAVILVAATLLSVLFGFRLGMNREDVVGYGLQVPAPGLDLSYTYAMNRASAEGRVFGRDFISTYGPFGYCIAGMDVPGIVVPWILSQLLLTIALGLAAGAYAKAVGGSSAAIAAATILLLVSVHVLGDEYRWLSLVLLIVLLGIRSERRGRLAAFAAGGFLAGFALLVKLSLGSGALLTVVAAALVTRPWRGSLARSAVTVVGAAAGLGLGLWLHRGSFEGLADYVRTAAAVTSGYSSAMSHAEPGWEQAAAAFGVFVVCLAAALLSSGRPELRGVAGALVAPTFVAWKHGVVRQDGHVEILVLFGLVLGAVALVEIVGASVLRHATPWLLLAAVSLARVGLESYKSASRPVVALGEALLEPLLLPGVRGLSTLFNLEAHLALLERESAATLSSFRLAEAEQELIGSAAVDIYPWEASYAAVNAFRWLSRPSPASFATYTPALDRRNAAFFASASRPPFVLWQNAEGVRSIDRRHLFWDEPLTLFTLVDHYEPAGRGNVLLLHARTEPRFGPRELLQTVTADWDQWLPLPSVDGVLLAEIQIDTPFPALVRRVLLREEAAFVAVRFANGERARFRYVPDQAPSGLWLQPLPRNTDDVAAIFGGSCPRTRVTAVRFYGDFRPGAKGPRITFWRVPGVAGPVFECGG
jgi:hypothetical protein